MEKNEDNTPLTWKTVLGAEIVCLRETMFQHLLQALRVIFIRAYTCGASLSLRWVGEKGIAWVGCMFVCVCVCLREGSLCYSFDLWCPGVSKTQAPREVVLFWSNQWKRSEVNGIRGKGTPPFANEAHNHTFIQLCSSGRTCHPP